MVRYQDWTGERKQKCKRGFATKREAQEWERSFQMQTSGDLDMTFEAFTELYTKDMKPRLKENTWLTKENIIQKKILPYFGKRKISEITTKDVIAWQNECFFGFSCRYGDEAGSRKLGGSDSTCSSGRDCSNLVLFRAEKYIK